MNRTTTVQAHKGVVLDLAPWHGPTPQPGEFGTPKLAVAAPADPRFAHLAWPKITRTPGGTLVAAFIAARFHGAHGEGCPAVALSHDDGATFSAPRVLQRFDAGDAFDHSGNVALGVTADGAVVLLAMGFRGDEAHSIFGWRSEDDGRTWSPVDVRALADGRTGSVYGHVFPVPGNGLAVVGHYRAGGCGSDRGLWISHSNDDGRVWGAPHSFTDERLVEPCVVHADGRMIGLFREHTHEKSWRWRQGVSENGNDWSLSDSLLAGDEGEVVLPSPFLIEDPAQPGQLYSLQTERSKDRQRDGAIYLWRAKADALDWQRGPCIARFPTPPGDPHTDFGYPWMAPLGDGRWYAVFYYGQFKGPNALWSLTLKL